MADQARERFTQVLAASAAGDRRAGDELLPLVYDELRRLAHARMARQAPGQSLTATELVHEAYLRLGGDAAKWDGQGHFFAAAAKAMRRILIDRARSRGAVKHGGGRRRVELNECAIVSNAPADELVHLDEALERLETRDARKGRIVELRFFGGLTNEETAATLGVSPRLVASEWRFARAWLRRELSGVDDRSS
jgi:RNA polymerase sigma factor (TIGR02999 family)